jgi:predicted nucleic acid-binding protein
LKLLLDTNVIVDFLKQGDASYNLFSLLQSHDCYTSIIVKLELLKFPDITPDEEHIITEFLQLIPIITFNEAIERQTILLSRATKLKLPDAIIGATAIIYDAEIVTRDPHFLNCRHEKLRIWKNA